MRTCPYCGAERPPTGGAFCGDYCYRMWSEEQIYGLPGEFEADVATALWEKRRRLFYDPAL